MHPTHAGPALHTPSEGVDPEPQGRSRRQGPRPKQRRRRRWLSGGDGGLKHRCSSGETAGGGASRTCDYGQLQVRQGGHYAGLDPLMRRRCPP